MPPSTGSTAPVIAQPEADVVGDGEVREERVILEDQSGGPALRREMVTAIVDDVNHWKVPLAELFERGLDCRRVLRVRDQNLGIAMLENVGDCVRVEAGVDGVEDRSDHWNAEMSLKKLRRVRGDDAHVRTR